MVTELKSENQYLSAFGRVRELGPTVPWFELVRSGAIDRFEQLGFPTVHDEEWKYTNLAPLAKESFQPATPVEVSTLDASRFAYPETANAHLAKRNLITIF